MRARVIISALVVVALTAGCRSLPVEERDNTARLIAHPEFGKWAKASPSLTSDALTTITSLEEKLRIAERRAK